MNIHNSNPSKKGMSPIIERAAARQAPVRRLLDLSPFSTPFFIEVER